MNAMNKNYIEDIRNAVVAQKAVSGMSQKEIADKLSITQQCLSRRMRHFGRLSLADAVALCNLLGVDLSQIGSRR